MRGGLTFQWVDSCWHIYSNVIKKEIATMLKNKNILTLHILRTPPTVEDLYSSSQLFLPFI